MPCLKNEAYLMNSLTEKKLNEWRLLIEERKSRGIWIKDFCKEKNITTAQFYYYQKIITTQNKPQVDIKNQKKKRADIKPIQIVNTQSKESSIIRFILPNSMQCVLPREMTAHEIKAILELMMSC